MCTSLDDGDLQTPCTRTRREFKTEESTSYYCHAPGVTDALTQAHGVIQGSQHKYVGTVRHHVQEPRAAASRQKTLRELHASATCKPCTVAGRIQLDPRIGPPLDAVVVIEARAMQPRVETHAVVELGERALGECGSLIGTM